MKIYFISCNWGQGGPGNIVKELYNVVVESGHTARFAYGRGNIPENVDGFRFADNMDIYSHYCISRFCDNEGFLSKRSTKRLIRDIEQFDPDIINIHNELGHILNIKMLIEYIRKSKKRTIWTLHDCWLLTGHCITGLCEKFGDGCRKCPRKREYPTSYILDRAEINYSIKKKLFLDKIENLSFVTPSNWLYELTQRSYLREYEVNVINNGIDLNLFCFKENDLRKKYNLLDKKVLLSVANIWSEFKGIRCLYELSNKLDENYVIVIIGDRIPKYIQQKEGIITFKRTQNLNELVEWYSCADFFVNPTLGDNFPTVNIEALACGLPVITFDTGGSGEIVGECGNVVPQGDIDSLANVIKSMRRIEKETCQNRAKLYSKSERYQDYLTLFFRLL